jgi:cytochrome c oxidase subunit III
MSEPTMTVGTTGKPHPYHMVRPSIWPFIGACSAGILAVAMVLFMHKASLGPIHTGFYGPLLGLALVAMVMFFWWKDVIFEAVTEKVHTPIAEIGLRYGMALFIASEVMFFVAFFWAYFDSALYVSDIREVANMEFTKGIWPPSGMHVIDPLDLPFLMTMILLLSGCTVTWAHHAILENDQKNFTRALLITVLLGIGFLFFQAYEYVHAPFKFTDGIYASTFFMATGFHGFHVFVGTIFLLVCYIRGLKGHFNSDHHFGFEAAAWYWHFVDVVWLFLFIGVYMWGNAGGQYMVH